MAIALGQSVNTRNDGSNSMTVTFGVAPSADDIIVLWATFETINETVSASGFTSKTQGFSSAGFNDVHWALLWKRAGGSEGTSYTASWTTNSYKTSMLGLTYSGCVTSGDPFEAVATGSVGFSSTITVPTITTLTDNAWWVSYVASHADNGNAAQWTPPSGHTEDGDRDQAGAGHKLIATAGATGTANWTAVNSDNSVGVSLSLKPAGATAGQPTTKRFGGVQFFAGRGPAQQGMRQWIRRQSGLSVPAYMERRVA